MKIVIQHKGWVIWQLSIETRTGLPVYVAIKDRTCAIEGVDIPDVIADINEAEFPKDKRVKLSEVK